MVRGDDQSSARELSDSELSEAGLPRTGLSRAGVPRTLAEDIAQGVSAVMAVGPFLYWLTVHDEPRMPRPVHFGIDGQPDRFGSSSAFWLLQALGIILFIGMTLLERVPHVYNYPFRVTESNRERIYDVGRQTMLATKTLLLTACAYVSVASIQTAVGRANGLGTWFVPTLLAAVAINVGISVYRLRRVR